MKPRNKLERTVVELSNQLPRVTEEQAKLANDKLFKSYGTRLKNRVYCLDCGHSWITQEGHLLAKIAGIVCPECCADLNMVDYNGHFHKSEYFSILTTSENFQIERVVYIQKKMKKKKIAEYFFSEVMQHWITSEGKRITISKEANSLYNYCDNWKHYTPMEPRTSSQHQEYRKQIHTSFIHPKKQILPILKRNGFKGFFHGVLPQKLFVSLLISPISETLLKTKQIELFKESCHRKFEGVLLTAIKTVLRNNYIVKDFSIWKDYVDLLVYFSRDLHNAKYVCPEDLHKEHDRYVKKKRIITRKKKVQELREQIELSQQQYDIDKGKFFGLSFTKENITISVLERVIDFMDEADYHRHCLFENRYYKKQDSLIFSAKVNNIPTETIEVSLKEMKIKQSRGLQNKASKFNKQIIELMNSNMNQIAMIVQDSKKKVKNRKYDKSIF